MASDRGPVLFLHPFKCYKQSSYYLTEMDQNPTTYELRANCSLEEVHIHVHMWSEKYGSPFVQLFCTFTSIIIVATVY